MTLSLLTRERIFAASLLVPCFLFVIIFALYPIINSVYLSTHRIILGLPGLGQLGQHGLVPAGGPPGDVEDRHLGFGQLLLDVQRLLQ